MNYYTQWVSANPILSAVIQFMILGTIGEIIPHCLRKKKIINPFKTNELILKAVGWALLGIIIKYGFTGMRGFTSALFEHNLLPDFLRNAIGTAFSISVLTNIFFGPQMMAFHRLTDNLILRQWNFSGLKKAWWTLIWFWIPAHTITFLLPVDYQIGLAAIWSIALGFILGITSLKVINN